MRALFKALAGFSSALPLLVVPLAAQNATPAVPQAPNAGVLIERGQAIFASDCAFCHGRDASGGETGPDLTRSKLVGEDTAGNMIGPVIRNGRPDKGMPGFNLPQHDIDSLVAFIRNQRLKAGAQNGKRRGVDESDLQTGDADAGRRYFRQACASCHSPEGDLAGIASRLKGLRLEERMLYPRDAKSTLTVTLPDGKSLSGTLAYRDEFTVALWDASGQYRSWPAAAVKYTVSAPAEAHVELMGKYSDADVHNLMAYLQTLR